MDIDFKKLYDTVMKDIAMALGERLGIENDDRNWIAYDDVAYEETPTP